MKGRPWVRNVILSVAAATGVVVLTPAVAAAQGVLTNGENHAGAIGVAGEVHEWTFVAGQGDAITVSIGEVFIGEVDPGFVPWIRLRRPDGTQVAQDWGALAAQVTVTAPLSGTYTVVVGSQNISKTGHYTVTVVGASHEVTPTAGPNGAISPSSPQYGKTGETLSFTVTPAVGFVVGAVGGTCGGTLSGTIFTTSPLTTSCTVAATFVAAVSDTDGDGDNLPDDWEEQFGLQAGDATGDNGAGGDPDGDGRTNAQELTDGTHPRGFVITYLAEGASSSFFTTRLALANPGLALARVLIRFQKGTGETVPHYLTMLPRSRVTVDVGTIAGLQSAEYSTLVEADVQVVADRTMSWDTRAYGAHGERGILADAATTWYFAEGATHSGFQLFYLIQNPGTQPAQVEVTYLRPAPLVPLVKTYLVLPQARFNVWVNNEALVDPLLAPLAATDISAIVRSTGGQPIVVERAMYLHATGVPFGAGHESAGSTTLSPTWFFAEGATGAFFDLFLLIGNPSAADATVEARYLLPSGVVLTRQYPVPARSRFNIWVDHEDPQLADTAVSTTLTSLNGVPIVAERAMWWPGQPLAPAWYEAHNSPGATSSGTRWAMAEGETGGPGGWETYVLIANTSNDAGEVVVTVLFDDGTTATRQFGLTPNSRFNVAMTAMFPETADRRYGVVVESVGGAPAQIVVERAMYANALGLTWAAGTNALATKLQ